MHPSGRLRLPAGKFWGPPISPCRAALWLGDGGNKYPGQVKSQPQKCEGPHPHHPQPWRSQGRVLGSRGPISSGAVFIWRFPRLSLVEEEEEKDEGSPRPWAGRRRASRPGHFWTSRSSGRGRGAGVQGSPERPSSGCTSDLGESEKGFLTREECEFPPSHMSPVLPVCNKSHPIAQELAARTAREQPTNHCRASPSSLPASGSSCIRNHFNPRLGDKTPAPSWCWAAARPHASQICIITPVGQTELPLTWWCCQTSNWPGAGLGHWDTGVTAGDTVTRLA